MDIVTDYLLLYDKWILRHLFVRLTIDRFSYTVSYNIVG